MLLEKEVAFKIKSPTVARSVPTLKREAALCKKKVVAASRTLKREGSCCVPYFKPSSALKKAAEGRFKVLAALFKEGNLRLPF